MRDEGWQTLEGSGSHDGNGYVVKNQGEAASSQDPANNPFHRLNEMSFWFGFLVGSNARKKTLFLGIFFGKSVEMGKKTLKLKIFGPKDL